MYIYKTTNVINNKIYIGQCKRQVDYYLGSGKLLKRAIIKYGKNNFINEIIYWSFDVDNLNEKEKHFIKLFKSQDKMIGYNITAGGLGHCCILSEDHKSNISKSLTNKKKSEEHVKNLKKVFNTIEYKEKRQIACNTEGYKEKIKNIGKWNIGRERNDLSLRNETLANEGKHPMQLNNPSKNVLTHSKSLSYEIISPKGDKYKVDGTLKQFCIEHKLSYSIIKNNSNKGVINHPYKSKKHNNGWEVKLLGKCCDVS
jgi:hypothetical protein